MLSLRPVNQGEALEGHQFHQFTVASLTKHWYASP